MSTSTERSPCRIYRGRESHQSERLASRRCRVSTRLARCGSSLLSRASRVYPFGPLMGTAANCCLVGYDHGAFVGINADAAAVPDLDMLAGCIREGFDAVIAIADVG